MALTPPNVEWASDLPDESYGSEGPDAEADPRSSGVTGSFSAEKRKVVETFEREYLIRVMDAAMGNVTQAASMASKNRSEMHSLLKKHGLKSKDFKEAREQAQA